jgi:hypothetical protein
MAAGILDQIQHMLEAALATVIGVGHFLVAEALAVIGQSMQALLLCRTGEAAGGGFIGAVHHQYQIESVEILLRQLPRTLPASGSAVTTGSGGAAANSPQSALRRTALAVQAPDGGAQTPVLLLSPAGSAVGGGSVGGVRYVDACIGYTDVLSGNCSDAANPTSVRCAYGAGDGCSAAGAGGF